MSVNFSNALRITKILASITLGIVQLAYIKAVLKSSLTSINGKVFCSCMLHSYIN